MGKLKIKDLENPELFKTWFREIADDNRDKEEWTRTQKNDDIIEKFRDKLEKLESDSNPNFEYGPGQKYEIRPNDNTKRKHHTGEWLYDFCLRELEILDDKIQNSKKIKKPKIIINLKKMILAMEIEMNPDEGSIRNDFHKLIQADSQYKIMAFQWNSRCKDKAKAKEVAKNRITKIFSQLKETVKDYEAKSDAKYLIFGWCAPAKEFMYSQFEVKKGRIYKNKEESYHSKINNSKLSY